MFIFRKTSRKDGKHSFATQTAPSDLGQAMIQEMAKDILQENADTIKVEVFQLIGSIKEVVKSEWTDVVE